jgi:hypothetical protein
VLCRTSANARQTKQERRLYQILTYAQDAIGWFRNTNPSEQGCIYKYLQLFSLTLALIRYSSLVMWVRAFGISFLFGLQACGNLAFWAAKPASSPDTIDLRGGGGKDHKTVEGRVQIDLRVNLSTLSAPDAPKAFFATDHDSPHGQAEGYECQLITKNWANVEVGRSEWTACQSPFVLTEQQNLSVPPGFLGSVAVRAVQGRGVGPIIVRPITRSKLFDAYIDGGVFAMAQTNDSYFIGGSFTAKGNDRSLAIPGWIQLNDLSGEPEFKYLNSKSGANNRIWSAAVDSRNRLVIAGGFSTYDGQTVPFGIVRLNADGSLDKTFNFDPTISGGQFKTGFSGSVGPTGPVWSIAIDSQNRIYCGGNFTSFNGEYRNGILRLHEDGSLDTGWGSVRNGRATHGLPSMSPIDGVYALTLDASERLVAVGRFTAYNGYNLLGDDQTPIRNIIRLDSFGNRDPTFTGQAAGHRVYSVAQIQSPAGERHLYLGIQSASSPNSSVLAKLSESGAAVPGFTRTPVDERIDVITAHTSDHLLIGGRFPGGIRRVNASNGSIDSSFVRSGDGFGTPSSSHYGNDYGRIVTSIVSKTDGSVVVGGNFSTYTKLLGVPPVVQMRSVPRGLAVLNADGTLVSTQFGPNQAGFIGSVFGFAKRPGAIIAYGDVTASLDPLPNTKRFIKTDLSGAIDSGFLAATGGFNLPVKAIVTHGSSVIVGGSFTSTGTGSPVMRLAKLNSVSGELDPNFSANFNGPVNSLFWPGSESDILVGGQFTSPQTSLILNLSLVNPHTGRPVPTFNIRTDGAVQVIRHSRRFTYVAGSFTQAFNGPGVDDKISNTKRIFRLNLDQTVDSSFFGLKNTTDGEYLGTVFDLHEVELDDGINVFVVGEFTFRPSVGQATDFRMLKIGPDGSVTPISSVPGPSAFSLLPLSNDSFLIGGNFASTAQGGAQPAIAKLMKIDFRDNSNGVVDTSFNSESARKLGSVRFIGKDANGLIQLGGDPASIKDLFQSTYRLHFNPSVGSLARDLSGLYPIGAYLPPSFFGPTGPEPNNNLLNHAQNAPLQ